MMRFGTMRRGQTVSVYVRGLSGMGKSTLVQAFLEQAKENFAGRADSCRAAVTNASRFLTKRSTALLIV